MTAEYGHSIFGSSPRSTKREVRLRAKHRVLESIYDFPEACWRREALAKRVLHCSSNGSPGRVSRTAERQQRNELLQRWKRAEQDYERQRAESLWQQKFELWKQDALMSVSKSTECLAAEPRRLTPTTSEPAVGSTQHPRRAPSVPFPDPRASTSMESWASAPAEGTAPMSPSSQDSASGWDEASIAALEKRLELARCECGQLTALHKELRNDAGRLLDELKVARQERASMERLLSTMTAQRDAWNARDGRYNAMLQTVYRERQDAHQQVEKIHGRLARLGSWIALEPSATPAAAQVESSRTAFLEVDATFAEMPSSPQPLPSGSAPDQQKAAKRSKSQEFASIQIQKAVRGRAARKEMRRRRAERQLEQKIQRSAAWEDPG